VIFVVSREVNVLTKIERRKKRQKLRDESVCRIIEMNVECSFHLKGELIGYMALAVPTGSIPIGIVPTGTVPTSATPGQNTNLLPITSPNIY